MIRGACHASTARAAPLLTDRGREDTMSNERTPDETAAVLERRLADGVAIVADWRRAR